MFSYFLLYRVEKEKTQIAVEADEVANELENVKRLKVRKFYNLM